MGMSSPNGYSDSQYAYGPSLERFCPMECLPEVKYYCMYSIRPIGLESW